MSFTVALVGRPNVGKSTLFNRLVGKRIALVHDTPGLTRDWRRGHGRIGPLEFDVLDTAGLEDEPDEALEGRMRQKTEEALGEADVVLFLVDARAGITPLDSFFANKLRRQKLPVILVANKAEGRAGDDGYYGAYQLGLGDPIRLSAEHGQGLNVLYDALEPYAAEEEAEQAAEAEAEIDGWADVEDELDAPDSDDDELPEGMDEGNFIFDEDDEAEDDIDDEALKERPIQLAIVGRPNAGKSTLVNTLLGQERMLTGPEPGITRDAIASDWEHEGWRFKLVDTAGLRRRAKVKNRLEQIANANTIDSLEMAQVVLLLIDANEGFDKQDLTIARRVVDEGRALVIGVNKWDAVDDRAMTLRGFEDRLQTSLTQVTGVPLVTISGLRGRGLPKLMDAVLDVYRRWNTRISTGKLNRWLDGMVSAHPPPAVQARSIRLRYMTQIKARPPHFAVWCSRPKELPESYRRYLMNGLRETFDLGGIPMRISLRKTDNPYEHLKKKR
ncbi:MAG: ribosome biogenesis GTPase Der [Alphaproteobacteria bacterium]|nr:ribosome biogenesis GTPase Der [Alphaproteobacteria bacterium SS10]